MKYAFMSFSAGDNTWLSVVVRFRGMQPHLYSTLSARAPDRSLADGLRSEGMKQWHPSGGWAPGREVATGRLGFR